MVTLDGSRVCADPREHLVKKKQKFKLTLFHIYPEGMVWTFTHKEPSSFETLGSQFSFS